ncbi:TRAP transporter substrate-binding protein DctP [Microvirga sp. BT689]|uniref:TRAP transporter substrate-binding protein DctP n=1 Tax=Microvirga arvi TaxID=2778731 RepID=UPI00194DF291|nr:TRAP transporter substrate-binding protein DctP [Microvirga arvi]MBM6583886.1 TRAP transporter substrate-binding protein DctP [Microvirga arvi]
MRYLSWVIAIIVIMGAAVRSHALDVQVVVSAPFDAPTRALIDQLKTGPELHNIGIDVEEINAAPSTIIDLVKTADQGQLRLGLVTLDQLIRTGPGSKSVLAAALIQPGQFPDTRDLFDLQDTPLGEAVLAEIAQDRSLVPLSYWSRGQTSILSNSPIRSAEDLRGRKVEPILTSPAAAQTMIALGVSVVTTPFAELHTALQRGVIDGAETSPGTTQSSLGATQWIATRHRPLIGLIVTGAQSWERLTEQQRRVLSKAVQSADRSAREVALKAEAETEWLAASKNLQIINIAKADPGGFLRASEAALPVQFGPAAQDALTDIRATRDLVNQIRSSVRPSDGNDQKIKQPQKRGDTTQEVPIVVVTDRPDEHASNVQDRFGSRVVDDVTITCGQITYQPEEAQNLGVVHTGEIGLKPDNLPTGLETCAQFVESILQISGRSRVLLFIHGYKNSFDDAVRRSITMANDIDFDGVVLVWSWPSDAALSSYARDEDAVRRSQHYVASLSKQVVQLQQLKRFDILDHSMGSRISLNVLEALHDSPHRHRVGTIILAAADETKGIVRDVLTRIQAAQSPITRMRTLYAAKYDRALQVSRFIHKMDRAGSGGSSIMVLDGLDSVDASEIEAGFLGSLFTMSHSTVFDVPGAIKDLKKHLMEDKNAAQRELVRRDRENLPFWIIPSLTNQ